MSLTRRPTTLESIRMILLLVLVAFVSLLGTDSIIAAGVITVLAYFVLIYRRRIKALERRLSEAGSQNADVPATVPTPPEPPAPPISTDA